MRRYKITDEAIEYSKQKAKDIGANRFYTRYQIALMANHNPNKKVISSNVNARMMGQMARASERGCLTLVRFEEVLNYGDPNSEASTKQCINEFFKQLYLLGDKGDITPNQMKLLEERYGNEN